MAILHCSIPLALRVRSLMHWLAAALSGCHRFFLGSPNASRRRCGREITRYPYHLPALEGAGHTFVEPPWAVALSGDLSACPSVTHGRGRLHFRRPSRISRLLAMLAVGRISPARFVYPFPGRGSRRSKSLFSSKQPNLRLIAIARSAARYCAVGLSHHAKDIEIKLSESAFNFLVARVRVIPVGIRMGPLLSGCFPIVRNWPHWLISTPNGHLSVYQQRRLQPSTVI